MRKTGVVAVAGAVAAVVVAGCGAATRADGPGRVHAPELGLAAPFGTVAELAAASDRGARKARSVKMTMETTSDGKTVTARGEGVFGPGESRESMTVTADGQTMEMRMIGDTFYAKMPPDQAAQMGGKPWLTLSPDSDDPLSKMLLPALKQSGEQSDPTKTLERIARLGRITASEQTRLAGEPVNHYTVEVDMAKAGDEMFKSAPETARAEAKKLMAGKDIRIPMQLWIDKDQLPLQVPVDESAVAQALGKNNAAAATGKATITYTGWGSPVTVTAPPADQTTSLSEMFKKAGR